MDFMVLRNRNTHTKATMNVALEHFWPAMRARNFVKHLKLHSGRPLTREKNLALLAIYARMSLEDIKTMDAITFSYKIALHPRTVIELIGRRNVYETEHDWPHIFHAASIE
jgi:hypothetical protein